MRELLAAAVLLAAPAVHAQTFVSAARAARFLKAIEARKDAGPLRCAVQPIRPALNFSFRFQAGYVVRVPLNQYSGPGHEWTLLVRIAPEKEGKGPLYLFDRYRLPNIPKTNEEGEVGGGYVLGEGRYAVQWTLYDDVGRTCRKEWKIDARLGRGDRGVKLAVAPGAVGDLSLRGLARPAAAPPSEDPPLHLTVLLHAGPLVARRTRLRAADVVLLLGTLSSLLEQSGAGSVRLIAFNLDQQKILYRDDSFTPAALGRLAQSIGGLQLDTVDYRVLENRGGDAGMLAELLNRELRAAAPSGAVVFLGPAARQLAKIPDEWLDPPRGPAPHFFFLRYKPFPNSPLFPDIISSVVGRLKGKTVDISSPGQFARAIDLVARSASAPSSAGK
jgi:hypothetical protein